MEKQNVGTGVIGNKLCYYHGFDDVYAAGRNYGRNPCNNRFASDFAPIFWESKNNRVRKHGNNIGGT